MHLDEAKAKRKCYTCREPIEKGEVVLITQVENPFGHKEVSSCKTCAIKGLQRKRRRIDRLLKEIKGR